MEREAKRQLPEEVYKRHRIATFGRQELAQIQLHYTGEFFLGLKSKDLDEETAERYELARRAVGHLRARTPVYKIRKIDVYREGEGIDDISVKVFLEDRFKP